MRSVAFVFLLIPMLASAQSTMKDFVAFVHKNKDPLTKGLTETTAEFETRKQSLSGKVFRVGYDFRNDAFNTDTESKALYYDADNEKLIVDFAAKGAEQMLEFDPNVARFESQMPLLSLFCTYKKLSSYVGQNTYGAKANVSRSESYCYRIVLVDMAYKYNVIRPAPPPVIFKASIDVPKASAKRLMEKARIELEIETKLPPNSTKFIADNFFYQQATISDPNQYSVISYVVPVVLRKAVLLDDKGKEIADLLSFK